MSRWIYGNFISKIKAENIFGESEFWEGVENAGKMKKQEFRVK